MGELSDLLRYAAGEASLFSALGRWRLRISERLDQLTGGGASGGSANQFALKEYAPVSSIVGAGSSENIAAQISFTTTVPNEKVLITWSGERTNAAAGGNGEYFFKINGVQSSPTHTVGGTQRTNISITDILTIAAPGTYFLNVEVAATVGTETVHDFSVLEAIGLGAV